TFFLATIACFAAACSQPNRDPSTLTFLIEANPTNLDTRFATDSQSQRIDGLLFSSLLDRDDRMNLRGDLAESWSAPDPLTYVFHLRHGVRFHDGTPLTSADVKASLERNPGYDPGPPPFISRVRFRVVPDAVVRALELRKGSAAIEMSSLSPDMIPILARRPELEVTDRPGTNLDYLSFNFEDPLL